MSLSKDLANFTTEEVCKWLEKEGVDTTGVADIRGKVQLFMRRSCWTRLYSYSKFHCFSCQKGLLHVHCFSLYTCVVLSVPWLHLQSDMSFIDEDIDGCTLLLLVDVGEFKAVVKKNPRLTYKSRILLGENWMQAHLSKRCMSIHQSLWRNCRRTQ